MPFSLTNTFFYALIPTATALLGGIFAYLFHLRPKFITFLTYAIAGLLIAVVALEFVPKIVYSGEAIKVVTSFLSGAFTLFLLRMLFFKFTQFSTFTLVLAAALDLAIEGILISWAFFASEKTGISVALSFILASLLINYIVGTAIREHNWHKPMQILTIIWVALMLLAGVWTGEYLLSITRRFMKVEILAFATGALLYLGADQLLGGSKRIKESGITAAGFFLGFALLLFLS